MWLVTSNFIKFYYYCKQLAIVKIYTMWHQDELQKMGNKKCIPFRNGFGESKWWQNGRTSLCLLISAFVIYEFVIFFAFLIIVHCKIWIILIKTTILPATIFFLLFIYLVTPSARILNETNLCALEWRFDLSSLKYGQMG